MKEKSGFSKIQSLCEQLKEEGMTSEEMLKQFVGCIANNESHDEENDEELDLYDRVEKLEEYMDMEDRITIGQVLNSIYILEEAVKDFSGRFNKIDKSMFGCEVRIGDNKANLEIFNKVAGNRFVSIEERIRLLEKR